MARTNATNRTTRQEHSPSASFNGSSTGITLGFKANSTGFTIAAWIKVRRFTAGDRIFDQQDSGPSKGFAVLMPVTASDRSLYFSVFGDSSEEANIKIALNIWEWTHIAISFEPNSAKFYKNGVLAGTDTSVSLGDSVTNLVIGKNASSAANYFNGLMKDFVVYDRVLSLAEVENVRDGIVSQTNLKCHLPLSSDLADISVNGNDGTGTAVFTYTNDSPFNDTVGLNMYAPLTSSLLLERGVGYPTWSRATKAWGFNELGILQEVPSGCAVFEGARLVRNMVPRSEVVNAGWNLSGVTASDANTLLESAGGTVHQVTTSTTIAGTFFMSVYLKRGVGTTRHVRLEIGDATYAARVNFDLDTGGVSSTAQTGTFSLISYGADSTLDSEGYRRFYIRVSSSAEVFTTFYPARMLSALNGAVSYSGDGTSTILMKKAEIYNVTGYDASYIPEYVSVGVASSPFFGAGADGAKYYETDWQGAPIPAANLLGFKREPAATNNLLYCRDLTRGSVSGSGTNLWVTESYGGELVTNGTFNTDTTGWTFLNASGGVTGGQLVVTAAGSGAPCARTTVTTTIGESYQISLDFIGDTSTDPLYLRVGTSTGDYSLSSLLNLSSTPALGLKYNFIATTATTHIQINGESTYSAGQTFTIDNVSVKTSKMAIRLNASGINGIANTATSLTATQADATILQQITLASAARCASAYVKRRTGTGTISFTQDGGSTWTDITSQINSSTWSRVQITATLANPSVGFKISTLGDAIDVDCVQNEAGAVATSPIVTTTAAVTRNADSLTYQTASNWSDTAGTAFVEVAPLAYSGGAIGSATNGLLLSTSNSGATASDGTNSVNGPSGTPGSSEKLAFRWGSGAMTVSSGGVIGTPGIYDGSMDLTTIGIGSSAAGLFKNVAIYNYAMTDAELQALTT